MMISHIRHVTSGLAATALVAHYRSLSAVVHWTCLDKEFPTRPAAYEPSTKTL